MVVIPALDEESTIGAVVRGLPRDRVAAIVVVDNGSRDHTAEVAREAGAVVVSETERGYGAACLAGLAWCRREGPPRLVAFVDADGSDEPGDLTRLWAALDDPQDDDDLADLVIGARREAESGALLPAQRFGNLLATTLLRLQTGVRFSDLGPFRAIRWEALERLAMSDRNYGWTVEMQLKAARAGLRCREIPVAYRKRRGGRSKVAGTLRGTFGAGHKILSTLARHALWRP